MLKPQCTIDRNELTFQKMKFTHTKVHGIDHCIIQINIDHNA